MKHRSSWRFSKAELGIFCQIGIAAGQVTFGSLFVSFFPIDKDKVTLLLLSLLLTLFFWGSSLFLTRRFHI